MIKRILIAVALTVGLFSFSTAAGAVEIEANDCGNSILVTFHNNTDTDSSRKYIVVRQEDGKVVSQTFTVPIPAQSDLTVSVFVPRGQTVTVFAKNKSLTLTNDGIGCPSR